MDANGLRFWMLAEGDQWLIAEGSDISYDPARRSLRLMSKGLPPLPPGASTDASARLERVPRTFDGFGNQARWHPVTEKVFATGTLSGEIEIVPPQSNLTDLAVGFDGVLYMAIAGGVMMRDLRNRWESLTLREEDFAAWRLAAAPAGGVWVLDRVNRKLARLEGMPFPARPYGPYNADVFRPCPENPHAPRLRVLGGDALPLNETPVGIACSPRGQLALLTWMTGDGVAGLRLLNGEENLGHPRKLSGVTFPYSFAWVSADRIAVLFGDEQEVTEAPVYAVNTNSEELSPVGDIYPLRDHDGGPFLHGTNLPPRYPTTAESGSAPLHRLSLPRFAHRGEASNRSAFDSGSAQTVWHRLYLEASIPPHCGIRVFVTASGEADGAVPENAWHEHRFGEMFANENGDGNGDRIPRGAWASYPSEIPFHEGLLHCAPEKNRAGLFTALVQRTHRRVRNLRGRYLRVRVELIGDGRATPEVAALRAYASRFSYLDHYLPELYRETEFGPDGDAEGRSTRADFLERFLDNFEGVLTPLEDRIAGAYLLTDARSTTEDALEWLGSWIGVSFDPAYPAARRREFLAQVPQLYRRRGTLGGLKLALEVATGGGVSGGEIVVLEDFRLRRTFTTILGADLADEDDPLLGGLVTSGNSYVGDTLFLGDESKKEFLALFSADLQIDDAERDSIGALFDRLAHRVTVLIHQHVEPQDLGLIRRVVQLETPAHVAARIVEASHPFMVGMAALVGVDTYLGKRSAPQPVRVGDGIPGSRIGMRDLVFHPPSLDPRLEAGVYAAPQPVGRSRPIADAGPDMDVNFGRSFVLNGSASRANEGGQIAKYFWTKFE